MVSMTGNEYHRIALSWRKRAARLTAYADSMNAMGFNQSQADDARAESDDLLYHARILEGAINANT